MALSKPSPYRRLRRWAGRSEFVRSGYLLVSSVRQAVVWGPEKETNRYQRDFAKPDPYGYSRKSHEQARYQLAAAMIDRLRSEKPVPRALEVGCHEGAFTELLIDRCDSVVATEVSEEVLARARGRLGHEPKVEFMRSHIILDPVPGRFDLIMLMDVLEVIVRPRVLRSVRDKVVEALNPGGYLLVTNSAMSEVMERSWWGRLLVRGGRHINNDVARHPELEVVEDHDEHLHAITLLRRVAGT